MPCRPFNQDSRRGGRPALGGGRQGSACAAGGIRPEGIEDSFETAKNECGLDHNETRSWHGWHRHVSLVMRAFAMLAAIRIRPIRRKSQRPCLKNNKSRRHQKPLPLIRWSIQKIRRIAQRIAQRQNKPSPRYRMVTLAKSPSSRRQTRTSKNHNHNCNASKPEQKTPAVSRRGFLFQPGLVSGK